MKALYIFDCEPDYELKKLFSFFDCLIFILGHQKDPTND